MKSTIDDEKVKDKIPEEDKKAVLDKCKEVLDWLITRRQRRMNLMINRRSWRKFACQSLLSSTKEQVVLVACQEECQEECLVVCQEECLVVCLVVCPEDPHHLVRELVAQQLKKLIDLTVGSLCSFSHYEDGLILQI